MQIEIGRYYQLRDGRVVGPVLPWDAGDLSRGYRVEQKLDGYFLMWDEEGKINGFAAEDNAKHAHLDLVKVVEYGPREAWADIAAVFDIDRARHWARAAAAIVKEMPVETEEDRRQIAAYNKLLRGLEHIIAEQVKTQ